MLRLGRVYAEYILRRLSLCTLARVAAVKSLSNPLWIVLLCVSVCVREKNSSIDEYKHTLHREPYRRSVPRAPRPTSGLRAYRYRGHPLKREISTFCLSP